MAFLYCLFSVTSDQCNLVPCGAKRTYRKSVKRYSIECCGHCGYLLSLGLFPPKSGLNVYICHMYDLFPPGRHICIWHARPNVEGLALGFNPVTFK
jgi:hypothetical protein